MWFSGGVRPCLRRWRSSFGPRCAGWSLRWLVPPTLPLNPQAFPSSLALLRDFGRLRAVRYAATLVAGAPRAAATLPALRHAHVRRHLILASAAARTKGVLDLQSVAVRSESAPRGPVRGVFISALLRPPGPRSGSVGSVAAVAPGRRGCRSRAGGCGRSGRGCRRRC